MFLKKTKNKKAISNGLGLEKRAVRQGFTLIEIIITMSIITLLSASMFQVISTTNTQQGLIMSADKIKAGIRLAQAYSLSVPQEATQQDVCGFGIYATGSKIIVYYLYNRNFTTTPLACNTISSLDYTPPSSLVKVNKQEIDLGSNYTISGPEIFFKAPYGGVISNRVALLPSGLGSYVIRNLKTSQTKTVTINSAGKISF